MKFWRFYCHEILYYSNAHRGKIRKAASALCPRPIIEDEPNYVPSKGWAEMIRKVYEVDPLLCPSCGGQMRIISFIEEPKIIDRITAHLKLTFEADRPPPPHNVQQELLMAAEEMGELAFCDLISFKLPGEALLQDYRELP